MCTTSINAAELSANCSVTIDTPARSTGTNPNGILAVQWQAVDGGLSLPNPQAGGVLCNSFVPQDDDFTSCDGPNPIVLPANGILYTTLYDSATDTFCSYRAVYNTAANTASASIFIPPTSVPIFTPLGIFATISGLLWFGRRRSIKISNL